MDRYEMIRQRELRLESIRGYIDKVLLPALNYKGLITVKPAVFGQNSYVYFLEGPGLEPLVLRGEETKKSLMRRIRGHQILIRHGFDVPEIVYHNLDPLVHQKFGFYFLVETMIPGRHFDDGVHDSGAAAARLGEMLARMHQYTSCRHGWPGEWRWVGRIVAGLSLWWKTRSQLKVYQRRHGKSSDAVCNYLKKQPLSAWFPRPRLTTGGYISSNVLVEKDRVVIIDLAYVRYAFAARDIAQIHFGLTRDDQNARSAFFEAYRQHASKTLLEELDRSLPLFEAIYLLRRVLKDKNVTLSAERDLELLRYCKT